MVNLAQLLTRLYVNLAYLDVALLPQEIALIILPIERGVAAADGEVNHDRLRPLPSGIVCPHVEVTARGEHRCHHIEPPLVVADGWCIDAAVAVGALQIHLRGSCQTVSHLFPMDEIFRVEHRHAREILKRAVYKIEVISRPAHAWVGMKAWQHRILEPLSISHRQ